MKLSFTFSAIILVLLFTCATASAAMVDITYDLGYTIKAGGALSQAGNGKTKSCIPPNLM